MIYLITGATNAGKDKIAEYMIKEFDMVPIVSTTSRPMRPKETEGKEYHFLTDKEFLKRVENGEFIEYRHYDTIVKGNPERWYYGVEKKYLPDLDKDYVGVIDYHGASEFFKFFGTELVTMFYVKTTYTERFVRNSLRGDYDEQEWIRRNKEDAKWLNKAFLEADVIINNSGWDIPDSPIEPILEVDHGESNEMETFEDTKKQIRSIVNHIRDCVNHG